MRSDSSKCRNREPLTLRTSRSKGLNCYADKKNLNKTSYEMRKLIVSARLYKSSRKKFR